MDWVLRGRCYLDIRMARLGIGEGSSTGRCLRVLFGWTNRIKSRR